MFALTKIAQAAILIVSVSVLKLGQQDDAKSSIAGVVYDIHKARVVGTGIEISGPGVKAVKGQTDHEGEYRFVLNPGTYTVEFRAPGFKVLHVVNLKLNSAEKKVLDVTLEVRRCDDCNGAIYGERWDDEAHVSGIVLDPNGAVIANAEIRFRAHDNGIITVKTTIDGKYRVKLPPGSVQTIEFEAPGFKIFRISNYKIGPSKTGSLNLDVVLEVRSCDDPTINCTNIPAGPTGN